MGKITAKKLSQDTFINLPTIGLDHQIAFNNWNIPCEVKAGFTIAHNGDHIFLKYSVEEKYVKGANKDYNSPVWEDSCVEFFISFDGKNYYNFEFNCIGAVLAAYGNDRNDRKHHEEEILKEIVTIPSLGKNKIHIINRLTEWNMNIIIPKSVFIHDEIGSLDGQKAQCNFYKCGDKLEVPHFLSWNPIETKEPDFHRPEFFGELLFEAPKA